MTVIGWRLRPRRGGAARVRGVLRQNRVDSTLKLDCKNLDKHEATLPEN